MPRRLWGNLWRKSESAISRPCNLLNYLVSAAGLEPATHALKGHCSTS
jgi:hypothetical protein